MIHQKVTSSSSSLVKLITAVAVAIIPFVVVAQTPISIDATHSDHRNLSLASPVQRAAVPLADHHMHIISVNGAALTIEPLLSPIEVPPELNRLLRDKERWGGQDKNTTSLRDLYTEDALVLDPASPSWRKGERALNYIISGTVINRLVPTAYEVNGNSGYIAGYEAVVQGTATEYVSNFFYSLRKGTDGKWRIAAELFTLAGPAVAKAVTADDVIKDLDAVGIKRATVLSAAYYFGSRITGPLPDEYTKVRAENDWAAAQVARYPDRLVGFCSFNPLRDYALPELERCASNRTFKGVKLHFSMSQVDLKNPEHVQKIGQVFAAANRHRLPILVHVRADRTYGREHVEILLNQILPKAPDIVVQIAHLWGGEAFADSALTAYADAVSANRPSTRNLYFDVAELELVLRDQAENLKRAATLIRQIGVRRVLWASDGPRLGNPQSRGEAWTIFRKSLPLNDAEFETIAANQAPYLR